MLITEKLAQNVFNTESLTLEVVGLKYISQKKKSFLKPHKGYV